MKFITVERYDSLNKDFIPTRINIEEIVLWEAGVGTGSEMILKDKTKLIIKNSPKSIDKMIELVSGMNTTNMSGY